MMPNEETTGLIGRMGVHGYRADRPAAMTGAGENPTAQLVYLSATGAVVAAPLSCSEARAVVDALALAWPRLARASAEQHVGPAVRQPPPAVSNLIRKFSRVEERAYAAELRDEAESVRRQSNVRTG